jgi:ferredoxin
MRVAIDHEVCFRHQRCFAHCPEVFGIDDEGYGVVLVSEVAKQLEDRVRECVERCPEEAISISD